MLLLLWGVGGQRQGQKWGNRAPKEASIGVTSLEPHLLQAEVGGGPPPPTRPVSCRPWPEWTPDLRHPPQDPLHPASGPGRLFPPIPKSRGDSAPLPGAPRACAQPVWPGFTLGARSMLETSPPHPQASLL